MRYIAMLRGVNLGSHNRILMPQLKAVCATEGLKQVSTYLQTGNIVFESSLNSSNVAAKVKTIILSQFGYDVPILVRTPKELDQTLMGNPFLARNKTDTSNLYFTFLDAVPAQGLVHSISPQYGGDDEWAINGTTVYVYCPHGYGRTKLTNGFFEKKLHVTATTRNYKTVIALEELASSQAITQTEEE